MFWVGYIGNNWRVLYYHFATHRFYAVPLQDAAAVARAIGLTAESEAFLCASILWRTVQRYGVRGYRYCLLDCAHVGSNLVRAARACGRDFRVRSGVLTRELEELLNLGHGEALTTVLVGQVNRPNSVPVPDPTVPRVLQNPAGAMAECPPIMSPLLSRALTLHRDTLHGIPCFPCDTAPSSQDSVDGLRSWASERYSAKDFTDGELSREIYDAISRVACEPPAVQFGDAATLTCRVICIAVRGLEPGCYVAGDHSAGAPLTCSTTAEQVRTRLWTASQKQTVARSCAFAVVIAARQDELAACGPAGYRHTVLNAGSLCAELYRTAAQMSVGTTSIGGFSDTAIASLLGDTGLYPIVIQAFGVPALNAEKADAARSPAVAFAGLNTRGTDASLLQ
jgi:hypothetical protein